MPKIIFMHEGKVDISIPTLKRTTEIACERWGDEIGLMKPSFYPTKETEFFIVGPANKKMPDSHDCVNFVRNQNFHFTNVQGLIIIESLDMIHNFLPFGSWTMGFDYKYHLYFKKNFGHMIACLRKDENGEYSYPSFPWGMNIEKNERVPIFK